MEPTQVHDVTVPLIDGFPADDDVEMVKLSDAQAYDDLISTIYRESGDANPWKSALEKLRQLLRANVACIRIARKDGSARQRLYAAGPKASPEALEEWEHQHPRDLLPFDLKIGEVEVLDW